VLSLARPNSHIPILKKEMESHLDHIQQECDDNTGQNYKERECVFIRPIAILSFFPYIQRKIEN
jgi:hypothetical protein